MSCLQFLMFVFNVIFWMIGATMLGIGIWMAVYPDAFEVLGIANSAGMNDALWSVAVYIIIGVGAFLFLIGFLGCVGARNPRCTFALWLYSFLVTLVVLAEIVAAILVGVYWNSLNDEVTKRMQIDVQQKYVNETSQDGISTAWNKMQANWKCCGSYNYTDYRSSRYRNETGELVPLTCCYVATGPGVGELTINACRLDAAKDNVTSSKYLYTKGCYEGLKDFIDANAPMLIGIAIGFAVLQIFGLCFACLFMRNQKRGSEKI